MNTFKDVCLGLQPKLEQGIPNYEIDMDRWYKSKLKAMKLLVVTEYSAVTWGGRMRDRERKFGKAKPNLRQAVSGKH